MIHNPACWENLFFAVFPQRFLHKRWLVHLFKWAAKSTNSMELIMALWTAYFIPRLN